MFTNDHIVLPQVGQLINRPGTGSQGLNSAGIDVNTLLNRINKYRASHQAGPESWDAGLASQAQQWVDYLAATGKFEHGGHNGAGQNLYGASGDQDATKACIAATDLWYSEVKNYDWNNPVFSQNTGHFTQVVWKGSTRVGYAMAKRPSGGYVISAHYVVPGNLTGAFRDNVLPRVS